MREVNITLPNGNTLVKIYDRHGVCVEQREIEAKTKPTTPVTYRKRFRPTKATMVGLYTEPQAMKHDKATTVTKKDTRLAAADIPRWRNSNVKIKGSFEALLQVANRPRKLPEEKDRCKMLMAGDVRCPRKQYEGMGVCYLHIRQARLGVWR